MTPSCARARTLLASLLLAAASTTTLAQTTVNPGALDQLAPPPPGSAPAETPAPSRPTHSRTRPLRTSRTPTHPVAKPPPRPALPAVPSAAPPPPVLPPPIVVPTRPAPPAPPVPVGKDAPGAATYEQGGMRVTFGVGRADMNPASVAAVQALAHNPTPIAQPTYSITAFAGGNGDDPSTPRRLALDRALAIRSILMGQGIPSERIFVKAMGPPPPGDTVTPDRVDIAIAAPPPAPGQPLSAATQATGTTTAVPARPFIPPTRMP